MDSIYGYRIEDLHLCMQLTNSKTLAEDKP